MGDEPQSDSGHGYLAVTPLTAIGLPREGGGALWVHKAFLSRQSIGWRSARNVPGHSSTMTWQSRVRASGLAGRRDGARQNVSAARGNRSTWADTADGDALSKHHAAAPNSLEYPGSPA